MPMVFGIQLLQCVLQLMFISRPIFQSCICLERYLAVVHPTVFLRFKPLRYSVHVLCVLKQPGPGDGSRGHESRNGLKRKAFTIIVITLVFTSISHVLRVFILSPTLLFASQQVVHLSQPVHQHRQRVHHPSAVPPQTWKTAMHGALSR
ncbi:uncharacterized protein LOC109140709 isoform X2 [Larimichthys crocea]|uniref:uncharacterized protein LOC109140709 isoform X2 n=1 Tax=Larimichthys crocea TaxID=215358 RepID=UPI000F5E0AB4|nr:uncharacterized protein LOC109140709 isoform X2 [Larimichthys crocea]